jgi:superfamily II DNA or RNA helicase/HKD family nuclease
MSRDKNLIDLISSYKTEMMDEPEVDLPDNLQWLLDQFLFLVRSEVEKIDTQDERVDYLNDITSNVFRLKNRRIISNAHELEKNEWLDKLVNTELFNGNILNRLKMEFENCQEATIISPFIKLSPDIFKTSLQNNQELKKISIITTTYGLNEQLNIDIELLKKIKAINPDIIDIKIEEVTNLNRNKRLHAKSYFFKRNNLMSTLYVGSSNFSHTGLVDGNEHIIKISEFNNRNIIQKFIQYKNDLLSSGLKDITDNEFVGKIRMLILNEELKERKIAEILKKYDEEIGDPELKYGAAEEQISRVINNHFSSDDNINSIDEEIKWQLNAIELYSYQQEAINNLNANISKGINKNIITMATGTGKTIVAMEYVNMIKKRLGIGSPRVLFIAHRKEILDQTKNKFIALDIYHKDDILPMYGKKSEWEHIDDKNLIIASVQTLHRHIDLLTQGKKFDLVIFDEVHHVDKEAKTFMELFNNICNMSNEVLGLTATPVRTNGSNVIEIFEGNHAYQLPLYEALEKGWLAAFDYYLLYANDIINFNIEDVKKLNQFMNNEQRFQLLIQAISRYLKNDKDETCLIFCSSIENAEYIKSNLIDKGFIAQSLTSDNSPKERWDILRRFKRREINFLCVVDIFNEGVDIPEINSIIFLRPTNSKLIFLQQLGRGLRLYGDKRLKVVDIINNINIDKNTTYNPLKYLSELTKEGLQISSVYDDVRIIDKLIPERCSFHIDLEDAKKIKALLYNISKSNAKKNNADALQGSYEKKDYGSYKTFVKTNYIDIQSVYDKDFSFLNLGASWQQSTLMILSHINMRDVIIKLQEILNSKQLSDNKIVNNLFIKMIFNAQNPFYGEVSNEDILIEEMFEMITDNLLVEFNFLCKYKLEETKLLTNVITNELSSFVGIKVQSHLVVALLNESVIDKLNMSAHASSAWYLTRENIQTIYIRAYEDRRTGDTSVIKYQNKFDTTKNEFLWISSWNVNDESQKYNNYRLKKEHIENNEKYKYLVLELKKDNGWDNKHVFTYLGATKKCTKQIKDNGDIIYIFDLND